MQINRLFEIVYILLAQKNTTAEELAAHFEVSPRTIYRDIDILSSAGVPVYTQKGKGGGIRLLDNFVLNKSMLTDAEQSDILSALQGLNAINVPNIEPVLQKLAASFNKNASSWIDVDFSPWGSGDEERRKFELIKEAILGGRVMTFSYYSFYGEKTTRAVEPLQIVFKEKHWYLTAFCRAKNDYRTFKITRMREVKITDERCPARPPYKAAYTSAAPVPDEITLRLSPAVKHRVYEEFDESRVTKGGDGYFTAVVNMPQDEWLYGYILSFGASCEVLAPESVRGLVKNMLDAARNNYL